MNRSYGGWLIFSLLYVLVW